MSAQEYVDGRLAAVSERNASGRSTPRRVIVAGAVIAVAVIVGWVQSPVLDAKSVWLDDESYVTRNPLVLNPSWASAERFVSQVQFPSSVAGYYQPLTMISLMLDSAAGGSPVRLEPFHRTSLGIHMLNTVLVVVFLLLLFDEPITAAMVGLLFGVHPLTVEPLAWMAERKTLLATCFALMSLIAYVRYAQTPPDPSAAAQRRMHRGLWFAASLVGYGLALLSKPIVLPLPILFVLLDYWPLNRLRRGALLEKVPFVLLGLVSAAATLVSQQNAMLVENLINRQNGGGAPDDRTVSAVLLTVAHNIAFYATKILWPVDLHAFYLPPRLTLSSLPIVDSLILTCLFFMAAIVSLWWTRAVFTGWLFFLVAVFPAIGVARFTSTIASEKFAYLPSLGFALIAAWALQRCWFLGGNRRNAVRAAICVIVSVLVVAEARATRRYLAAWHDDDSLYSYVLDYSPQAWWVQYDFGDILADEGRIDDAVVHYQAAEAGEPDDVDVVDIQQNLGNALFSLGRVDEAVAHYEKVLRQQPDNVAVRDNLGLAYAQLGRRDDALAAFSAVLAADPSDAVANNELGRAAAEHGERDQAVAYYRAALEETPDFAEAHVNLADTLQAMGQLDEAVAEYRIALQLEPGNAAAHNNLAAALLEKGMVDDAITQLRAALQANPDDQDVQANLRAALARRGGAPAVQ